MNGEPKHRRQTLRHGRLDRAYDRMRPADVTPAPKEDTGPKIVQILVHEIVLSFLKTVLSLRNIELHLAGQFDGIDTYVTTPKVIHEEEG